MKVAVLACVVATAVAVGAACSGGGARSSGATVIGHVEDEAGGPIAGADVDLDGETDTTDASGGFRLAAHAGTQRLEISADGYRRVEADLRIAHGDNDVEITMVVCTPAVDAGCPTPPPTGTPTPNVLATFAGQNPTVNPLAGGTIPSWSGSATLDGVAADWQLGQSIDASDVAFSECYSSTDESDSLSGSETLHHCIFWWDGNDEGAEVDVTRPDALFLVRIPAAEWSAANTITLAEGMTAGYYEADFGADVFSYQLQRAATVGTLTVGAAGVFSGEAVSISGQASFYIPNLP